MAFIRPAVHVYQQYITAAPATITPFFELCIVGPSYLVVRDKYITNSTIVDGADYNADSAFKSDYPGNVPGTTIDTDFTTATMKDASIKIWPTYTTNDALKGDVEIQNDERVTKIQIPVGSSIGSFSAANIKIGDLVFVTVGTSVIQSTVNSIIDATTFYLSKNIPTPLGVTGTTFTGKITITRPVTETIYLVINPKVGSTGGVGNGLTSSLLDLRIGASLTIVDNGVTYRVYTGKVYVTYRALRTYLASDFTQIRTSSEADGVLGVIDVANPLRIACTKVFENAAISFKVLAVGSDDISGYVKALDLLSTNDKVYIIIPLTQNVEVVQAYNQHITNMSSPEKSKWRIMYASLRMPNSKVVIESNDGVIERSVTDVSNAYLLDQADGKFGTKSAAIGDFIDIFDIKSGTYSYSVMITGILNDSVAMVDLQCYNLTTEGYVAGTGAGAVLPTTINEMVRYRVNRKLSTYGIATEMTSVAKSYSNRRLRLVEPDEVVMTINNVDVILPGYYLCAAYGAMRAAFPPHQGFTTLGVSGFKALRRSNKFFTDDDLDLMAGQGIFVVVQDSEASMPHCIYQTTTDITDLESKEDSIVATVDFASMFYRDNLKAVIGKFNVNEISEKYVATVINDCTAKMKRMTYPYIGSVIVDGQLNSMTTNVDKILPVVGIKVPFPVNEVDLYLQV